MSDNPIVKGYGWASGWWSKNVPERAAGYIDGQHDLVAAGYVDMSHYRRRSPEEKPEEKDGEYVIFLYKEEYQPDFYRTQYFLHNISLSDVEWWAYLYIPTSPSEPKREEKE